MNDNYYTDDLWSEILPGLWQGGTDDYDVIGVSPAMRNDESGTSGYFARKAAAAGGSWRVNRTHFDTVITLYASANAASWNVKELRYGFADGDMSDLSPEQDLELLVREAHRDWKAGKKVLIRCQAGLNRSGLITALVLIRDGRTPDEAIDLIREKRCGAALSNQVFERWLTDVADLDFWRAGLSVGGSV